MNDSQSQKDFIKTQFRAEHESLIWNFSHSLLISNGAFVEEALGESTFILKV